MTKHVSAAALIIGAAPLLLAAAPSLEELEERVAELVAECDEIQAKEDFGDDDAETIEAHANEIEKLNGRIAALKKLEGVRASAGRRTAPEPRAAAGGGEGDRRSAPIHASPRREDPRGGWESFGAFGRALIQAARTGERDQRLLAAATTYGSESTGVDGGFLVPAEFRRSIWQKVMAEENLLTRCEQLQTASNSMTIPKDETAPWQTSGGVQVYWEAEGRKGTESKPALETTTMRLNKLFALVPITEELLEDAPGIESWLRAKAPSKMAAKINTAIIRGTGVGQPYGLLNSASVISVPKESSQPADTIRWANIVKMWARMYAPSRRNAIWLVNQDIEPQLDLMAFDPAATAGTVPVYLPSGGASAAPYATLKGRPVVPIEACSTLGDKGDIILADMSQYYALTKAGQDIRTDVSMHLYFDQDIQAFRFIFRVTGQPAWGSAITPENGNMTRSWAVTLDERA